MKSGYANRQLKTDRRRRWRLEDLQIQVESNVTKEINIEYEEEKCARINEDNNVCSRRQKDYSESRVYIPSGKPG